MATFLSSDFHFGHKNISGPIESRWESGYRIFNSLEEMNHVLVDTINHYVKENDELYFGGDWIMGGEDNVEIFRNLLNVQTIHFILGNHDKWISEYAHLFTSVQTKFEGEIDGVPIYISHHPNFNWYGKNKGVYHAYGHCHSTIEGYPDQNNLLTVPCKPGGRSMDVGIDNAYCLLGEWRPFKFEEFVQLLNK